MRGWVGIGLAAVALTACGGGTDGNEGSARTSSSAAEPVGSTTITSGGDADVVAATAAPASDPVSAVRTYLRAVQSGDDRTAFGLLTADERSAVGSAEQWGDESIYRPVITGFEVADRTPDSTGTRALVASTVRFEPAVDMTVGVVPASADVTWVVRAEDGGWRVAPSAAETDAHYPADTGATETALAWVRERQACTPITQSELTYDGSLLGMPIVADRLCHTSSTPAAQAPTTLMSLPDPTFVVNAFGPEAAQWARIVPVDGPLPLDVVTAPFGDRWVVVGVIER